MSYCGPLRILRMTPWAVCSPCGDGTRGIVRIRSPNLVILGHCSPVVGVVALDIVVALGMPAVDVADEAGSVLPVRMVLLPWQVVLLVFRAAAVS